MKLDRWRSLLDSSGPFASITLDTTRGDESGQGEVRLRWEAARRSLGEQGAPAHLLDELGQLVTEPTGRAGGPGRSGVAGRFVVVTEAKVLLDEVLTRAPAAEQPVWGPVPHLLPALRTVGTPYILVKIDRSGADVEVHGATDSVETTQIEGEHDVLHKVSGSGRSQLHYQHQHRAEDSWERNATEVAHAVAKLEREHRPALVLLAGDERSVGAFAEHAGGEVSAIMVKLSSGGRAVGISEGAADAAVAQALDAHRVATQKALVERFRQGEGRQDNAVQGLADVVDSLRRSQVEEIMLRDVPSSTRQLWVGDQALQLATTAGEVRSMGVGQPRRVRADAALAWAALASDAGITLLADGIGPHLEDGIAAVLRWSDRSTPREALPSMPGHGGPRGGEPLA